jgi:hypothetical protein
VNRLAKSLNFILIIIGVGLFLIPACQQNSQAGDQYLSKPKPLVSATEELQGEPKSDLLEEPDSSNECLACHIDKQQLIDTADPEEEHITENEGQG